MKKLLTAGIFGTILGIVGAGTANASIVSSGFLDEKLTEYALSTSLDLKANQTDLTALSNKIGTLPDGLTVANLYDGWTDSNKITYSGLNTISQDYASLLDAFGTSGLFSLFVKGGTLTVPGFPTNTILPLSELSYGVSKIGDLPSGNFPIFPEYEILSIIGQPLTYPTSLAELITAIYGNSETDTAGLLAGIIAGFPLRPGYDDIAGLIPNFYLAKSASDLANANATKIGTLPSGGFPERPELTELLIWAEQEHTYPTSLSELITALYGNPETGKPGLLFGIVGGFETSFGEEIGFGAAKVLANKAQATADANTAKIGTLPTEYATVGAALTAIKGIAEDAKAAALAAIPDPKQEGSSGKFVLTVDIVGDNATYRWEKIDREGETTTTE